MKGAAYHRVSTLDQHPELARAELRAAAAARGIDLVLEVEETGSGARNDRPGLARVLRAVEKGEVSAVLVWKLDRFGRSLVDIMNNARAIERAGARFLCTSQGIDIHPGSGPEARFFFTILAAVSELERGLICERTRMGLARARKLGRRFGRPPALSPADCAAVRAALERGAGAYLAAKDLDLKETTVRRYMRGLQLAAKKGAPKQE